MNIDSATANLLSSMKHQRNILKARETKVSLIALRNNWKRQQDKLNYQNEYDRIRGLIEGSVLKGTTVSHLDFFLKTWTLSVCVHLINLIIYTELLKLMNRFGK